MSVWIKAMGKVVTDCEVNDELIAEFIKFSEEHYPVFWGEEHFSNPWYFDDDNYLCSFSGKFGEMIVWYEHMKREFFNKRGIKLLGEPNYVGETECRYFFSKMLEEENRDYLKWQEKRKRILSKCGGCEETTQNN